jgi:glycosyltransferase involved in cell wall biosynthesis
MKVSVIIPTLNEEDYITVLLNSLSKQIVPPEQIIIVDGHSKDKTRPIVKHFKKITLLTTNPPVANQRNYGAKKATGDLLIFLDADTKVTNDFIQKIKSYFKNKKPAIACPWFIPMSKNPLILGSYVFFSSMFYVFQKLIPSGAGTCLIVKKNIFLKSTGFSEEYKFEDIELIRRLAQGYQYQIIPLAVYVSPLYASRV